MLLAVEDAQRILVEPLPALFGQVVAARAEMLDQRRAPGFSRRRIAERVELELDPVLETELVEQLRSQGDDLDIGGRLGRADDLGVELVELPESTLLGTLVAEGGAPGD